MAFYNAVIMLTGNEMAPRTEAEFAFVVVSMISGAILYANIFGEMTVLVQTISRKTTKFQTQRDMANTVMENVSLPSKLQDNIRDYFLFTQFTLDEQEQLDMFLGLISPSLRLKVQGHIFADVLIKNWVFSRMLNNLTCVTSFSNRSVISKSEFLSALIAKLETTLFIPEDVIIRQNDPGKLAHSLFIQRFNL